MQFCLWDFITCKVSYTRSGDVLVKLLHRYHTEFLDADIFRLVFSRRINILKLKVGALI